MNNLSNKQVEKLLRGHPFWVNEKEPIRFSAPEYDLSVMFLVVPKDVICSRLTIEPARVNICDVIYLTSPVVHVPVLILNDEGEGEFKSVCKVTRSHRKSTVVSMHLNKFVRIQPANWTDWAR